MSSKDIAGFRRKCGRHYRHSTAYGGRRGVHDSRPYLHPCVDVGHDGKCRKHDIRQPVKVGRHLGSDLLVTLDGCGQSQRVTAAQARTKVVDQFRVPGGRLATQVSDQLHHRL